MDEKRVREILEAIAVERTKEFLDELYKGTDLIAKRVGLSPYERAELILELLEKSINTLKKEYLNK